MNFTLAKLASVLGLSESLADAQAMLSGVAVDSRRVQPGDLFVALPGARVDGHDYAREAAAAGARAVLGQRRPTGLPGEFPVLVVPDAAAALLRFAGAMKREAGFRLAAIAGSVGKTTTKEFAAAILSRRFAAEKTPGNQNSAIGFPMSVVNLPRVPQWMVGEMGMSALGEISRLSRTFEPDVAAITLIAAEHLEFLGSLDTVASANAEILEGLKPDGIFVVNAEDTRLAQLAASHSGRMLRFGRDPACDVAIEDVVAEESGSRFKLKTPSGSCEIALPLPGIHQVSNYLAACAVAVAAGAQPEDCAAAAPGVKAAAHRGELLTHRSGALLYDDAYNASPPSVRAALDTLKLLPGKRKIAVLGDMLELGAEDLWWHREAGRYAVGRADRLVCVGPRARAIGEGAVEAGMPPENVSAVAGAEEAAALLEPMLGDGDTVLFKASRSVGVERAVQILMRAGLGTRNSGLDR
ncbi:MAG TPA: UDP-N-acetylmuramoyl-tripeptide--D-alanyl-D-alanine ligase [Thermoanaerobaculia bacterium]|nr:UDP-N-acetylmuramoyl-tripeptide--D-alanyl-D-alanine ligase [Thermoanaerobaculia bacterium]